MKSWHQIEKEWRFFAWQLALEMRTKLREAGVDVEAK